MVKKFFLTLALIIAIVPLSLYAQNIHVTGQVSSDGEPLIGVSVLVKGTSQGTVTDINGRYSINVPSTKSILQFSFLGYKTQERIVDRNRIINVSLAEDTEKLDEVVVLGYGANARKQDLSASVGVVSNADRLSVRPVSSTTAMLQGQLAGVTISSDGGSPTSGLNIVIRGQGSQNGDNVLWVVDGVPNAPISSPSDVESIVVLKDAASAAIYGAQSGAGGVILVTTKKARQGEPSISYDGTFGIRQAMNLPQSLTAEEQIKMRTDSYTNAGMSVPDGWNTAKNPWITTTRTDWMDEIFRTAVYQRHNVAFNVGTDKYQNRLSLAINNNDGVLINTFAKSTTVRYNGSFNLNKWVKFGEDLSWIYDSSRGTDTNSAYSGVIMSALYMPRSATVYNSLDGSYGGVTTEDPAYIAKYGSNFADIHGDAINPVRLLEASNIYSRGNNLWSTSSMEIANVIPGLKFNTRFSYNLYSGYYKAFSPIRDEVGKPNLSNSLDESTSRNMSWATENTLTYDNTFGKHSLGLLLSTTSNYSKNRGFGISGSDFSDESKNLQYITYASSLTASDYLSGPDSNVSLISRLSYSYNDLYFMTFSYRRDYAGRLPKENNYGDFPAATIAWKISNEKFFPKNDLINLMKIRASWGRVGNLGSIGWNYNSPILGTWGKSSHTYQYGIEKGVTIGTSVFNNKALNQDLTWETSEQTDFGLDLNMIKNKLSLSLDYFEKKTFNLIQGQTMNWPSTIGVNAMLINQGEIRNRGFEVQADWKNNINKDFSYFISGNFSWLKNWVSDIGVKNEDGTPGVWTGDGSFRNLPYLYQTAQGKPLGSYYLIKTDGIFQSNEEAQKYVKDGKMIQSNAQAGDLKFVDYNNDGKIDDNDRQYCGNATPKTTFSFSCGFTYKNFSLNGMLQGVGGAQALNVAKCMTVCDVEGNFNRSNKILDAWSPTNTSSDIPRLSKSDPNLNFSTPSDWFLENASYLRLKNVTLAYDLTSMLRSVEHFKSRNSNLSIYLSGENLLTITDYSGIDPECGGYDAMKYPVSRIISFGIKLNY